MAINFYSSVFLIIMQGQGKFQRHSIATTVDMFMSTILLYPLSILFGVIGILFSRLIGFFSMIYKYLRPIFLASEGEVAQFRLKDLFNRNSVLVLFAVIFIFMNSFLYSYLYDKKYDLILDLQQEQKIANEIPRECIGVLCFSYAFPMVS